MFAFRYLVQLKTTEKIGLFGEDYYNDRNIFSYAHRNTLNQLCEKVDLTGFPITIKDLQSNETLEIDSKIALAQWLIKNQPPL
jgi:hypothetical protein